MGTYNHRIRPLKPGKVPSRFIVLASAPCVERKGAGVPLFLHRLRLGAVSLLTRDGDRAWSKRDYVYHTTEELVKLLNRLTVHKSVTWLMAHDLAYHLTVSEIWLAALRGDLTLDSYHLQGRHCTARLRIGNKVLHCIDSSNYLDRPWQEACALLGCSLPQPPDSGDTDAQALDRAREEVIVVCELIQRLQILLTDHARGTWGWSLGSLAWGSWRRMLNRDRVHVHCNQDVQELEREAYVGGHEDCRYIGKVNSDVCVVDYNSLYAACMLEPMPVKLVHCSQSCSVEMLEHEVSNNHLAVAQVTLRAHLHDYPFSFWPGRGPVPDKAKQIPSYMRTSGHWTRLWCRGKFQTVLATPELRLALEADEVDSVQRVAWYEAGRPFDRFVEHWYKLRLAARGHMQQAEECIMKRLLTMLPGKFGQKSHRWIDCPGMQCQHPFGHWYAWHDGDWQIYRALAGRAQAYVPDDPDEWQHSCPAISAHVTSAARVAVDVAVRIAGLIDVYYHDTDALHVSRWGFERLVAADLVHDTELGKLKLKGVYRGASYRNIRDYTLGPLVGRDSRSGPEGSSQGRMVGGEPGGSAATGGAGPSDVGNQYVSTLHGGSAVNNLFNAADCWRSYVSVDAHQRNRYVGRVTSDGWIRPLVIGTDSPAPSQPEIFPNESILTARQHRSPGAHIQ